MVLLFLHSRPLLVDAGAIPFLVSRLLSHHEETSNRSPSASNKFHASSRRGTSQPIDLQPRAADVEKELQSQKPRLLSTKLSSLRHAERRCLLLEKRKDELGAEILVKKSEIGRLDADYDSAAEKYRALRGEIGEVERKKKEKDAFYEM